MLRNLSIILSFLIIVQISAQEKGLEFPVSEMSEKLTELTPTEKDYQFIIPKGWSNNLMSSAKIIYYSENTDYDSLKSLIDNNPSTNWISVNYTPRPEIIFDIGNIVSFNKLVVYNKHSVARGTGGGNNATKEFEILVAMDSSSDFISLGTYKLNGPRAVCFLNDNGGKMCMFINTAEPNIITLEKSKARFIKIKFISAFWSMGIPTDWASSISLSEIMLFNSNVN